MKLIKIYKQTRLYKEGDSVRVKQGVFDCYNNEDIGGFEGRILSVSEDEFDSSYEIELDSITLKQLSKKYIKICIDAECTFRYIEANNSELEPALPRDQSEDVIKMQNILFDAFDCHHLKDDEDDDSFFSLTPLKPESKEKSDPLPDETGCDNCSDCSGEDQDDLMEFLEINSIDHFIFCDKDNQHYSIQVPYSALEKIFFTVPFKESKLENKDFKQKHSLN